MKYLERNIVQILLLILFIYNNIWVFLCPFYIYYLLIAINFVPNKYFAQFQIIELFFKTENIYASIVYSVITYLILL